MLQPTSKLREKGLLIEEATLAPDDEQCVSIPIQNFSNEPLCWETREMLGKLQPVTLLTYPTSVVEEFVESIAKVTVVVSKFKDVDIMVAMIDESACERTNGDHILWEVY